MKQKSSDVIPVSDGNPVLLATDAIPPVRVSDGSSNKPPGRNGWDTIKGCGWGKPVKGGRKPLQSKLTLVPLTREEQSRNTLHSHIDVSTPDSEYYSDASSNSDASSSECSYNHKGEPRFGDEPKY